MFVNFYENWFNLQLIKGLIQDENFKDMGSFLGWNKIKVHTKFDLNDRAKGRSRF